MALEKGRISSGEATLLMVGFILGSSILFSPGRQAGHMSWLAILLGGGASIILVLLFTTLMYRFPGKTLVEIADTVYGAVLGKLIGAAFIFYLVHLGSFVVRDYLDFLKTAILIETPISVILVVELIVCGYVSRCGVEVLGRCSQMLVILTLFLFFLVTILLLNEFHLERLLPFYFSWKDMALATYSAMSFPFGETVAFMMIMPFINQRRAMRKTFIVAVIIGVAVLVAAAIRTTIVMGRTAQIFLYPNFYVAKLIDIGDLLSRMEILVSANFLFMGFLKISVLLYGASLGTAQIFRLSDYRPIVFPVGVLMFIVSIMNFQNFAETMEFVAVIYHLYALPFILGIPLLTLVVALIRGLPKKEMISRC